MALSTFGAIMRFASEMIGSALDIYKIAIGKAIDPNLKETLQALLKEKEKNYSLVEQTRQENVTEMILEPIRGFVRAPFCEACEGAGVLGAAEVLETARRLEARAQRYYTEAAEKISALPEVARSLKAFGKIRKARQAKLAGF